ncbi:MAG: ABC transporter permease [Gemmatimonadaceae bacterium]|jgi:spermidine/putrescine transport system permease protein|nr:ABC transporter permease [Gemmatimonadaceae bacterium]
MRSASDYGRQRWLRVTALGVLAFLYLPILTMVVFSFNENPVLGLPLRGPTLDWYRAFLDNEDVLESIVNGALVAAGCVCLGVGFGLPAAIALDRHDFPGKAFFRRIVLLPIILPGVITGVALLNFLVLVSIPLSLWTIVLGVGTALICITVTEVFARLQQVGRSQEEAAENLGATPAEVFSKVTLPNISTALWGSALITYAIAFDELAVTYLLTGRDNTLPMALWSMLRREATPEINAIATTVFAASAIVLVAGLWLSRGRSARAHPG